MDKVSLLLKREQWKQHTDAWYDKRKQLVTASSDVRSIIASRQRKGCNSQAVLKKKLDPTTSFISNRYIEHGNKYENIAVQLYQLNRNVKVFEVGLVVHNSIKCLGASPDGVSEDGRLIEIKCPSKRKINGKIPHQYFVQMQTQMEVCDIDVCDYVECLFTEYNNYIDYKNDGTDRRTLDGCHKGLVGKTWKNGRGKQKPEYFHPPFDLTSNEQYSWLKNKQSQLYEVGKNMYINYWKACTYLCQEVPRNKDWWEKNSVTKSILQFWEEVIKKQQLV